MNGTWKVTGGAGGSAVLAILAIAAAVKGAEWAAARIWWILGTGVVCAALCAAAVRWLIGWSDRHDARVWSQRPAQLNAQAVAEVPRAERRELGPAVVNLNFYGLADGQRAAVIRQAIEER